MMYWKSSIKCLKCFFLSFFLFSSAPSHWVWSNRRLIASFSDSFQRWLCSTTIPLLSKESLVSTAYCGFEEDVKTNGAADRYCDQNKNRKEKKRNACSCSLCHLHFTCSDTFNCTFFSRSNEYLSPQNCAEQKRKDCNRASRWEWVSCSVVLLRQRSPASQYILSTGIIIMNYKRTPPLSFASGLI